MQRAWRGALAAVLAAGLIAASPVAAAQAQDANQVTGLTVGQADGFATLGWQPVAWA